MMDNKGELKLVLYDYSLYFDCLIFFSFFFHVFFLWKLKRVFYMD